MMRGFWRYLATSASLALACSASDYAPPGCERAPASAGYNWTCQTPPPKGALPSRTSALVRSDPKFNGGASLHSAGDNRFNPATGTGPRGSTGRTIQCQGGR